MKARSDTRFNGRRLTKVSPMIRAAFAVPGDLNANTGGYIYARRILERFADHGVAITHLPLSGAFPAPDEAAIADACEKFAALGKDCILLADGLAWGAMPERAIQKLRGPIVALCHHPLYLENGVSEERRAQLLASEKKALSCASFAVASSQTTRRELESTFGFSPDRIIVAEPGTERAIRAQGSQSATLQILAVGAVSERKAYDVLVDAMAQLGDLDWRLTIAGSTQRAPETFARLQAQLAQSPVAQRITLTGEVPDAAIEAAYASADVFVLSSHYEGYGMVLAEAMARGLPIVTTTGGAAAQTAPDGAALKVPPGDANALAQALRRAITDRALRAALAENSWAAGQALPDWDETTNRIAMAIRHVAETNA